MYGIHVLGLIAPGQPIPVLAAHRVAPGDVASWGPDDVTAMVEEGRRQLDRQLSDLERIRGRSQWLFTVAIGVLAAIAGAYASAKPDDLLVAAWLLALGLLAYGTAGAAAVMTVRADFATIDTAVLSQQIPPIPAVLAGSYARMLRTGENTVATRLTVFRQAVVFVIAGGYIGLIMFLLDR